MEVYMRYPMKFINFIGDLQITPGNMIIKNELDKETDFVSRYFTPHPSVGELARKVLGLIQAKEIRTSPRDLETGSLVELVLDSDLLKVHPNLLPFLRSILLETFALDIAINHIPEFGEYISQEALARARENISYTLDIIGVDPRFVEEHKHLLELYIALGYLEAQVPVIKADLEAEVDGEI